MYLLLPAQTMFTPVVFANDTSKNAEGDGDQGPDDQDDHNGPKG